MYLLKQFIKYDTIRRTLTLNIFEEYGELEAGEHEFAWSFIVPASTAVRGKSQVEKATRFYRVPLKVCRG